MKRLGGDRVAFLEEVAAAAKAYIDADTAIGAACPHTTSTRKVMALSQSMTDARDALRITVEKLQEAEAAQ